ncbi:P-loop containing nucleoside triphosphate hydrolase protein [Tribonema minus]|uniref:P-loop containing nucleoside triphosphate hydrolase protein n=1 Tax=Tribonema minus TaxID=303371 RepID=A0A835Z8M1_9STRA|nr:P-loop containing nucleoside triphosphate hydrolase protein [Tribonema minus]
MQSQVFEVAYNSAQNMLVCAPTGAGKTNVAMLALLQLVKRHMHNGRVDRHGLKAVYVAPMKALAQEVVAKFSQRLKPLGLVVKEYTGDMQLTRAEVCK